MDTHILGTRKAVPARTRTARRRPVRAPAKFAEHQASSGSKLSPQKTPQSFLEIFRFRGGEPHMRIAKAVFVGSIAASSMLAVPALAKHSDVPKREENRTEEKSTSPPPCHVSVLASDGSTTSLPCEEVGSGARAQQKPPARSADGAH